MSSRSSARSACSPDSALTRRSPSGSRTALRADRFSLWSSTSRMPTGCSSEGGVTAAGPTKAGWRSGSGTACMGDSRLGSVFTRCASGRVGMISQTHSHPLTSEMSLSGSTGLVM